MANAVILFDYSEPETCLESIRRLERELLSSRIGPDVFVGFNIDGNEVYLHVQRDDLYVTKFHLNNTPAWSIDRGGSIRNRQLGFGHSYANLWEGGIENVTIGFPRFRGALLDITGRFDARGATVSAERDKNRNKWDRLLKRGLASLIVMVLEPSRSLWFKVDLGRLLINERLRIRTVTAGEGNGINNWGQISATSRQQMGNFGWTSRSCPIDEVDVTNARNNPIYARDFTTVRCLTTT